MHLTKLSKELIHFIFKPHKNIFMLSSPLFSECFKLFYEVFKSSTKLKETLSPEN